MTTVTLRSASPATLKADAVVIGVQSDGERTRRWRRAGRRSRRLSGGLRGHTLKRVGVSGKPGDVEQARRRSRHQGAAAARRRPRVEDAGRHRHRSRCAERPAPRSAPRAGSRRSRWRCRRRPTSRCAPWSRVACSAATRSTGTWARRPSRSAKIVVLTERARTKTAAAAVAGRPGRGRRGQLHPRPGQHAAQRPVPGVVRGRAAGARPKPQRPRSRSRFSTRRRWRRRATAASSASARARPGSPGWPSSPTGRPRPKAHIALVGKGITFDSGGLSIKTGGRHDDDEVRHGRSRGRSRPRSSRSPSWACRSA